METQQYEIVIVGTRRGSSKFLAWTLGKQGKRVAVIERKYIGGSCPNIACLPSKSVIHNAKVASYFQRSEEFGIAKQGFKIDMAAVRDRKRKMVRELVDIHVANFKASEVELIMGSAKFTGPKTIEASLKEGGRRVLQGEKIVIGTGTRAMIADTPGLLESNPLTHIEALELDYLPQHLIVLGGGYIGLELAQAMRRLGSRVTIVDRNERLANREDEDVSAGLEQLCRYEGIELVLNAAVSRVEGTSGQRGQA